MVRSAARENQGWEDGSAGRVEQQRPQFRFKNLEMSGVGPENGSVSHRT